jgi:hypothetical protein
MPFKAPTPPTLPPVPATPAPAAVFGQSVTLSAAQGLQIGSVPRATSAASLYVPSP